jgi:hypothetical protein
MSTSTFILLTSSRPEAFSFRFGGYFWFSPRDFRVG